jgi:DNA-binding NarL/FixJ family response regulator
MSAPIKVLVALDSDIDRDAVEKALPLDSGIQIVGLVDGLEDSWTTLQETPTDLLAVACDGASDRALYLIDGAVKQQPDRPVVVITPDSANGFVRRAFEAGADDIITLPQSPDDVAFALHKAMARKQGASAGTGSRSLR